MRKFKKENLNPAVFLEKSLSKMANVLIRPVMIPVILKIPFSTQLPYSSFIQKLFKIDLFFICRSAQQYSAALDLARNLKAERVNFVILFDASKMRIEKLFYKHFFCTDSKDVLEVLFRSVSKFVFVINYSWFQPTIHLVNLLQVLKNTAFRTSLSHNLDLKGTLAFASESKTLLDVDAKNLPTISVIVTSYNAGDDILECLNSLKNCKYSNLEIVVVDDNSSDDTYGKVEAFRKDNPDLKIISFRSEKNNGTYVCRNIGINLSTSAWITFQDSDDYSSPTRFHEIAYSILNSHSLNVAFIGFYRRILENGVPLIVDNEFDLKGLITLTINRIWALENIGYFDSVRTLGDTEYFQRLELVAGKKRIGIIRSCLYLARFRESSLSSKTFIKQKNNTYKRSNASNPDRLKYISNFKAWHSSHGDHYIPYPLTERKFDAPVSIRS